jgi:uncharacterized cupredoxin-like copper-binding protein
MRRFPVILATGLLVVACSAGGSGSSAAPSIAPTSAGSSAPSAATRIEVKLLDALRIEPAAMTVPMGVPVTFVVTNAGSAEHEFYLGDDAAQAAHEQEMMSGGMAHGDQAGIALKPGETKELTHTFAKAGETLAGCHVIGHYGGGMKAAITVT